jgi:uroporphyrinogen decarboxylase
MNSLKKERVKAVLKGEMPDRIVLYDLLFNDAIIEHYAGKIPETGQNGMPTVCGAIGKCLDMTRSITPPAIPGTVTADSGEMKGFTWTVQRWTGWITRRPFSDLEGAKKFINRQMKACRDWNPTPEYVKEYRAKYEMFDKLTDGTVVLHDCSGVGLDGAFISLGLELFSYLMADDPDLLEEWLECLVTREIRRVHSIADPDISPVVLTHSDIASQKGLLFSPGFLRKALIPRLKRLSDAWHDHGVSCLFHSDGDISEIMEHIVPAGSDGLNPFEKTDKMDIFTAFDRFGDKIYYAGGVDVVTLSTRSSREVKDLCERIVNTIPHNRLFLGSTTEIGNDIPLENFLLIQKISRKNSAL